MAKDKPSYKIVATTYTKKPTGEIDKRGRLVYETTGKRETVRKETNFADLKKNVYDASKKQPNTFVNYGRQAVVHQPVPRRVNNVTVRNEDGSKTVTYFKAVSKNK